MFNETIETRIASGEAVTVGILARRFERPSQYHAKARIHVSIPEASLPQKVQDLYASANEVKVDWRAVSDGNQEAIEASLESGRRWARANKAYSAECVRVASEVLRGLNVSGQAGKLAYRRKAGCSCGCSPAVVAENSLRMESKGLGPIDIFVEVK